MFCNKCGTQSLEGAEFCQKCGAKLIAVETTQQTPNETVNPAAPASVPVFENSGTVSPKKKKKWLIPLIAGVVIIVIIAIVASQGSQPSTTTGSVAVDKYVQMIKKGALNSYPQVTVGEAFDEFLANAKWESGVADDGKRYVDVTGIALYLGEDAEIDVQFRVDYDEGTFEINAFEIDGEPQSYAMLWELLGAAYKDDSSLSSDSLWETFKSEAEGISFDYPKLWVEGAISEAGEYFNNLDNSGMTMIMYLLAPTVGGTNSPVMNVRKAPVSQAVIDSIFSATLADVKPEGNMMVTEIEDITLDGVAARKFTLVSKADDGTDLSIIRYAYIIGSTQYRIEFYMKTSSLKIVESALNGIIESYTIIHTAEKPTDTPNATTEPTLVPEPSDLYLSEINYAGKPVYQYLNCTIAEIEKYFGLAEYTWEVDSWDSDNGIGYFEMEYTGISFKFDSTDRSGQVYEIIVFDPSCLTVDGVTLEKNRNELIAALGEPEYEDGVTDWEILEYKYILYYVLRDMPSPVLIEIELPDADSEATLITVGYSSWA